MQITADACANILNSELRMREQTNQDAYRRAITSHLFEEKAGAYCPAVSLFSDLLIHFQPKQRCLLRFQ